MAITKETVKKKLTLSQEEYQLICGAAQACGITADSFMYRAVVGESQRIYKEVQQLIKAKAEETKEAKEAEEVREEVVGEDSSDGKAGEE